MEGQSCDPILLGPLRVVVVDVDLAALLVFVPVAKIFLYYIQVITNHSSTIFVLIFHYFIRITISIACSFIYYISKY